MALLGNFTSHSRIMELLDGVKQISPCLIARLTRLVANTLPREHPKEAVRGGGVSTMANSAEANDLAPRT